MNDRIVTLVVVKEKSQKLAKIAENICLTVAALVPFKIIAGF